MKKLMFYDPAVTGHHLEFNLNLLHEADANKKNDVFILGNNIQELIKYNYEIDILETYSSLEIVMLPKWCNSVLSIKLSLFNSLMNIMILTFYKIKFKVSFIIILNLNDFLRLVPFFYRKVSISGILFNQRKFINNDNRFFNYWMKIFVSKRNVKKIFVLNDLECVELLNTKFDVEKFVVLNDPVMFNQFESNKFKNRKIILLFLGVVTSNKGILEFINALCDCEKRVRDLFEIRIIGKVNKSFTNLFYEELNRVKESNLVSIYLEDNYVTKIRFINELVHANYIMLIYKKDIASSGILGYSKLYNKNIIGTREGFIGHEIENYQFGFTTELKKLKLKEFCETFEFKHDLNITINIKYLKEHSFSKFYNNLCKA